VVCIRASIRARACVYVYVCMCILYVCVGGKYTQLNITNSLRNSYANTIIGRTIIQRCAAMTLRMTPRARALAHSYICRVNYNIRTSAYDVPLTPLLFGHTHSFSLVLSFSVFLSLFLSLSLSFFLSFFLSLFLSLSRSLSNW